ncbi:MAG: nuclear transport factor 2 family protein [Aquihabitans sp.]
MIDAVIERWHQHLRGDLPGGLDELLAEDVVFYSPVVFTPQRGKEITKLYLSMAAQTFAGSPADASTSGADPTDAPSEVAGDRGFRYTKQVLAGDTAVLEFETTMDGKHVNGVDIITADETGHIVEFRVMIRPLQAVQTVHRLMMAALEQATPSEESDG